MPRGDRTGLLGTGPVSERDMRYCSGFDWPGFVNPTLGSRIGFGFGYGRGDRRWRHRFYATGIQGWVPPTLDVETADLKAQADFLSSQLDVIQKRIEELKL